MEAKRVVKIASRLVRAKSENPPGDERAVAKELQSIFEENKIAYEKIVYEEKRINLIARVGKGKRKLLFITHSDTVPAGDGWSVDPFGGIVMNGKLYGRGAQDDKGHIASAIEAMIRVRETIDGELILAVLGDEETGGEFGIKRVLKEEKLKADGAILIDASKYVIDIAEKGPLFLKLKARGKSAHGAYPERGENAISKMIEGLKKIEEIEFKEKHKLLGKPTINIGTICGGEKTNMVPAKCEATLDLRLLPGQDKERVIEMIRNVSGLDVDEISYIPPCEIEESDIVSALLKSTEEVVGKRRLKGVSGCTGIALLQMPAVATGFGDDCAHKTDEFISVDDLENGAEILALTAERFLNRKSL